ncbi:MAG: SufE family protein [Aureliella sp.]
MYNTRADIDRLVETLQEIVTTHSVRASNASAESSDESSDEQTSIAFAAASRPTIVEAAEELVEEFLLFDDKQSKTELLMELGEALPDTFVPLKALTTPVPGCMSEVYLIGRPVPDAPNKFEFVADSNAQIVRGLIALLQALFSGQLASDVLHFDVESLFRQIGLDQFVSSQRRSGLDGMIRRIRALAQAIENRSKES